MTNEYPIVMMTSHRQAEISNNQALPAPTETLGLEDEFYFGARSPSMLPLLMEEIPNNHLGCMKPFK